MDKRKLLRDKIEMECSQYCRNILRKRTGTFKDDVEKVETYKNFPDQQFGIVRTYQKKGWRFFSFFLIF